MPAFDSPTATQEELSAIDKRLAELEAEKQRLVQRKQALLRAPPAHAQLILSPEQKVKLFRDLFRGRSDLFAVRWQNAQGRHGYSVACHNEWLPGICKKPKVKCGNCGHKHFKALDEQVIYEHLAGKQVVGLYPLLPGNRCHLLAADFDKTGWQDAVKAMAKVCHQASIPQAVEISRSGNGAHLWIFFSEPVLAQDARRLGFALLDKAMEIHPGLSFDSYDRLFPNQDHMPEGGFGNLIALPLQHHARRQGNSLFVDADLHAYPDQWRFLSQLDRLSADDLSRLLRELEPERPATIDKRPPWEQGLRSDRDRIEDCPESVTLTLANHIYIKQDAIPAPLIARLKRLASFSNPVFFKTQALRFSTHGIPRFITCARIEQGYLSLPRGCLDDVKDLLKEQQIQIEIEDHRRCGQPLNKMEFLGALRPEQSLAIEAMAEQDTGILHAPTAFGKTVTAIGLIAKRRVNTLILTHSRQLLDQWNERIQSFTTGVNVGIIGGGKKKPTEEIDIATYQSLINKKDNTVSEYVQRYGQVIIDECHHISAPRYEMLLNEVRAKYIVGLTATPDRQDGHQKIMFMVAGPIRHKVKAEQGAKFQQTVFVNQRYDQPPAELRLSDERPHIASVYRWLATNGERNAAIAEDVVNAVKRGRHPLLLTERREHAEALAQLLASRELRVLVLRGAMRASERKSANEQLASVQVVVATGKYVGEGFDLPRLDTLFLALPIAWKGSLAQYAGRLHREVEGKEAVTIYDYLDSSLPMLQRMFQKREKGYAAMGYDVRFPDQDDAKSTLELEL
ncbi:TOTE conflict system archaeo-eukaryotic primase domain-containing protein [Marinobacterium rhizophilum]|uniref:TOTE conflict system archaeo-eukaryotic primase domain-containing protein n=1 Tax=Marinobacterium rhizophilum TaxID=420402 RepID=UPI00036C175C|nr:DEAD/DEAH box helicase [Marinobacterium rhizophilum]